MLFRTSENVQVHKLLHKLPIFDFGLVQDLYFYSRSLWFPPLPPSKNDKLKASINFLYILRFWIIMKFPHTYLPISSDTS